MIANIYCVGSYMTQLVGQYSADYKISRKEILHVAEKRMISKSISISEKVNLLPDIFDMLLFTWLVPHSDDFGRLAGSPVKVKALVVPMLDKSIKDIERSLSTLHNAGLIDWYEVSGNRYIQIVNFEKHQTGLHKRTNSKFPDTPGDSRKFPEIPPQGKGREGNRTEEKGTEEKGTEGSATALPSNLESIKDSLLNLVKQCNIKHYTLFDLDKLYSYIGVVDVEVIEAAIKKATNKDHINYAINTVNGMMKDGITTKEQLLPKHVPGQQTADKLKSGKPKLQVVKDESKPVEISPEERERMRELARKLRGDEQDTAS